MTRVVLCADDYGLDENVSRGIVTLARIGRISATSAMMNGLAWPFCAREILACRPRVAVGLHLTLTWGRPLGPLPGLAPAGAFPPVGTLIRKAWAGHLAAPGIAREVAAEIERQLDAFEDAAGGPPDFVDGHQHVHVLPGIREALLAALVRRGLAGKVWLRNPADRVRAIVARRLATGKALFVAGLAAGFGTAAARAGLATNAGFSGFSPFRPERPVGPDMARYLDALGAAHLAMCHPGESATGSSAASATHDAIAACRPRELAYLASDDFRDALRQRAIELVPAPQRS